MPLKDNLNSKFIESKNALNKRHGSYIEVFVENETDVPFWSAVFNDCGVPVKVQPASKTDLNRGKQEVLKRVEGAGNFLLLCVDSDYDYLLDGATPQSKTIKENPYVFQTYTYSIENHKCYAETLHQVIVDATLVDDKQIFDYEDFMERYSRTVYELFAYSFYFESKNQHENADVHPFSIEDFCKHIKLPKEVDIQDRGVTALAELETKVRLALEALPEVENNTLLSVKEALTQLGVTPKNTYCFVKGHIIYDNVVLMFLKPIFKHLKIKKIETIKSQHGKEGKPNNIKQYQKEVAQNIESILRSHTHYKSSPMLQKIRDDIQQYRQFHPQAQ